MKKFFKHTIISFIIGIIDIYYRYIMEVNYNKKGSILLIASFITVYIFLKKDKQQTKNINQISFLKENEYKIKDNIKYNRKIEWGIEEEPNWRNKWNPSQPKETISFNHKFLKSIFLTIFLKKI